MVNDGGIKKKLKTMREEEEGGALDNNQPGPSSNVGVEMGAWGYKVRLQ